MSVGGSVRVCLCECRRECEGVPVSVGGNVRVCV